MRPEANCSENQGNLEHLNNTKKSFYYPFIYYFKERKFCISYTLKCVLIGPGANCSENESKPRKYQ
jgi:hypothetical protein